jgi:hypothetical protein
MGRCDEHNGLVDALARGALSCPFTLGMRRAVARSKLSTV